MRQDLHILADKARRAAAQARHLPRVLRLVWAAARAWTVLWATLLLAQGLLPVALVYLTKGVVDGITAAVAARGTWDSVAPVAVLALAIGLLLVLGEVVRAASGWTREAQARLIEDHVSALVHEKSTSVDLAFYEWPDFHDHLHRARDEATYRPVALLESVGSLIQNSITLVAMAAVLVLYGWWLAVALPLSTIPAFVVVLVHAVRQHQWRRSTTANERLASYYTGLMTSGGAAPELRMFALGGHFRSAYQSIRAQLRRQHLELSAAQGVAELLAGGVALRVAAACLAWMAWRRRSG